MRTLLTLTADQDSRVTGTFPVPTDLADGEYRIAVAGATSGDGFTGKPVAVTTGWWQVGDDTPAPTGTPSASATTVTATAGATTTAPAPALARTGVGLGLAIVATGLTAAGGLVLAGRRRA